ncbi:NAD(P)/FAD-dependent oxidoreductase [Pseudogracilibacillus auburnensis]|uniref:NADH dehydrogenase FAD-containing subunit n=1 Tax=Pseudogracilibacillus auburnensis TaxID=1494959 RepID=A0A2V3W329_9BACI|nr:FAD-dependent oxidoreductase [Pseudogracilibacillus auburnensis]MBO1002218.1 FAD-dependent oxidoreductase [Pseudogracilibacillus auburnensis]PXW87548.1 NADH dehydrogenase FAD-containing subunit [Pseudogracilibacillus auburnensis]
MKKLVILGGGYGGIKVLTGLLGLALPEDLQITVVDKNPYHSYKTEFHTIVAGTAAEVDVRTAFPLHDQVHYEFGEIRNINLESQEVYFRDKSTVVPYDYLVIALGCEDTYHGIEGAEQYTESVQSFSKARHTGLAVGNLKAYGKVSVVGAGLSGIEVASEIRESRPDLNIRLLDRGASVLKAFDPKVQAHVADWFVKNDVEVLHHSSVEYVEKDGVCNNGVCYVNDVTIWTAGVQPHRIVRELPFQKDKYNKVAVNKFFQVPNYENIYVIGDNASSVHSPSGQLAGQQGEQVAIILDDILEGKEPKEPREIRLRGTLGSLGKSDGFGSMFQKSLTGLLPRLTKSGVLWLQKRH